MHTLKSLAQLDNGLVHFMEEMTGEPKDGTNPEGLVPLLIDGGLNHWVSDYNSGSDFKAVCAMFLGRIGHHSAVDPLIAAFCSDGRPEVRVKVVESLQALSALDQLVVEFPNRCVAEPTSALAYLEDLRVDGIGHLLICLMGNQGAETRIAAAERLGSRGNVEGVAPLIAAAKDGNDRSVQEAALNALGLIGDWQATDCVIEALNSPVDPLDRLLEFQAKAIEVLGILGDPRAAEPLIAVLGTTNEPWIRVHAARALGKIADNRAVEPLIATLNSTFVELQDSAAEALGLIGDHRARIPLYEASKFADVGDPDSIFYPQKVLAQFQAAVALGRLCDPKAPEVIAAALDPIISELRQGILDEYRLEYLDRVTIALEIGSPIPNGTLREIASLAETITFYSEQFFDTNIDRCKVILDSHTEYNEVRTTNLRQLARQELIQRGEETETL